MYICDENNIREISFESKIRYHHPVLFYPYEKNELWVQYMDRPNIINRFVFVNNISSLSIVDLVYNKADKEVSTEPQFVGLLLTYERCHRIAQL